MASSADIDGSQIGQPNSHDSKFTHRQISLLAISELVPAADNPRKHSREQVRGLANSIQKFKFNAPILIDKYRQIVAGHARYEAAKLIGLNQVPVIFLDHLTETEAKAYRLADNRWASGQAGTTTWLRPS
jgi:ParB/RepB/Spo0J family partition protein